jgi:hypothetical protein
MCVRCAVLDALVPAKRVHFGTRGRYDGRRAVLLLLRRCRCIACDVRWVVAVPGNDDYGTMSAWQLFAYLGFYPVSGMQCTYAVCSSRRVASRRLASPASSAFMLLLVALVQTTFSGRRVLRMRR